MATKGGQIEFDVGFNVNSESLKAVREELKSIQSMTTNDIVSSDPYSKIKQGLRDAQDAARDLDNILQDSFNQDLGVMNITKFQQGIERSYGSLNTLQAKLSGAGDVGTIAFRKICTEIITTNSYIKKTDALISKIATTLGNTLKWNISSSVINRMTGSIQEAWGYTKALDSSLNNIQIVTNKSSEDMAKFAIQANDAAKALKTTTTAYTDAALTFYQQGLSDEDVAARAKTSLKVSNVTGLSGDQSAEYVTAVLNGYKVAAEDAEEAMDKLAAVGAATASSLAELSEAMAKVASAANAMGVSEDQLAATLSTVISVTRQDASTVGTAFKTIYARISDIKAGSEEAEISLGNYTKKMAEMGFSVLDSTGNMRDLGEVIEEIGGKWATLSREQQISLAQTMAGTRQYNNLIALFDNWAEYEDALNVSMQANGTLQKQQEIYAESLAAKLKEVKAAKEDLFDSLINTDSFKNLLDIFTKLINVLSTFVDSIGGGGTALAYLGSILTKVFNKQIAGSIQNLVTNLNGMKQNAENAAAKMQLLREMTLNNNPYVANFAKAYEEQLPLMNSVSEKTREIMTATLEAKAAIDAEAKSYDNAQQEIEDYFKAKTGENYQGINEKGEFNQKQNNQLNVSLDEDQETFSKAEKELTDIETKYERLIELQEELDSGKIDLLGNSDEVDDKLNELINLESYFQNIKTEDFLSNLQTELDNAVQLDLFPSDFQNEASEIVQQLKNAINETGEMDLATLMGLKGGEGEESLILILSDIFKRAGVKFETKIEEMKQQASEDGQQRGVNIRANQQQAEENQQNVLDAAKLETKIQKYTDLASSVMGVVGAIQTLQNLGNIWNNEDISIGEKITQTAMALSAALTALIPALQTLIGLEKVKAVWDVILAKTGNSVLLASLAIVASFTAIIAVGAGLVLLFKDIQAASPEGQLKKAQAAADATAESLDKATQKVQDLKDAFDNYDKIVDKLNSCTIGTQEWKEALQEANDQILALLEKYPELQEFVSRDASGMLSISEEGQKQALKNASIEQNKARIANMGANAKVAQAQEKVVKKDLDNASYNWDESLISDNIDALRDLSFEEFSKKLEEIGYDYDQTEGDLKKLQSSINNLGKTTDVTASKMEILGQEMAAQETAGKYGDNNAAITEMTGELNEETYNNIYKNVIEQTKKGINANSFDRDKEVVDLMSRYNAATGKNLSVKAVKGTDNNRSFDVRDENGDIKNITAEQMAAEIAAAEALQEVSKNAELASNALANMKTNIKDSGLEQGLQNYITSGNLESMTQEEYDSLVSDIGDKDIASYLQEVYSLSDSEMQDIFGENYAEDFQKALDNYGIAFDTFKEGVLLKSQAAFDNLKIDTDKFSVNTKKNILNALNNAAINGGKEGLQEVENLFNNMSTENVEAFANSITNIDWKSENVADLRKTLEEAGVTTDFTDEQLKSFIHTMRGVGEAADFSTLAEQYKNLHDIIDGLQQGDTISQEDYDKLGAAGQSYFRLMLDGSYKLIGDAEEFYNTVNQQSIQGFQDNIEVLKEKNAALQNITTNAGNWEDFQSVQDWGDEQKGVAQLQLDYLSATGYDPEQVAKWQEELDIGQVTSYTDANGELVNSFNDISQAVTSTGLDIDALNNIIKQNEDNILQQEISIGMSARNFKELRQMYEEGTISLEAFNEASREMDAIADLEGLDPQELSDYTNYLQEAANNSDGLADSLKNNDEAAKIVAKSVMKMNKGIEALSKGFKKWRSVLDNSSDSSQEYAEAMSDTKDAMGDLLDINKDFISDDFVAEHLDEIAAAAKGDEDAIDSLKAALADDIMAKILVDNAGFINNIEEIQSLYENLKNNMPDLEVGATLESGSFIDGLNELISSTGMTVEQVNALCDSLGFEAAYTTEPVETVRRVPVTTTYHEMGPVTHYPKGGASWTETERTETHYEEDTGEFSAFAMDVAPEGQVATPKISGLTKKAGGSMNNASSSNKGGGGKGGGGSKAKEPDKMDKIDNTIDRYHDINIEIKQLETQFDRLGKAQDKLVGQDLINNLNQQLKILEKQIDAYQRKLALERQEAAELQGDLSGKGVTFNADGTISNYAESLKAQEDYVNSLIEKYNNMSAEEQEAYKEVVEQAKEDFEKFKENIERYDTIITDEIPGLEDQIQDAFDQQIEINIKKFTMSVELRLEMKQAEEDWNKFKRKIIDSIKDENILGQGLEEFENLKDYFDLGDGTGTVQTLTNQVNNTMAEIEKIQNGGTSDVYGDNLATALEDLQKYNTELMTQLEDIDDLIADIEQGYLDTMDEVSENMKKQVESYEYINDLIESDIELVKLLYGEDAYDSLGAYYSQKHDNYLKAIDFDRKEVDFWETEMNKAKQAGDTEVYNKALEKYRESISRLNEDVNSSVQNIIDQYSNAINKIFDNLDKKFTGGQGLEFMQEEWELINANADRYLDTINSTYEVQKLQSKYQDAINNTDSISAQKKLNALMEEEIGMLEKKDKLSQYDIDRANMKYEIALKQIALEEAQKNKSSMKMKRDAQGNYSYVYAGDEEDISAKQQELADAQNQLYNLDKEQYQQNLNDMMSYYADFTDKYKELMLDTTLSDEEREKKKAMLIEQYGALINSIQTDNETIRRNLSESTFDMLDVLYETDAISFELMTGLNANNWETMSDVMINKIQTDLVPSWESGIQEMINLITEEGGLEPTCKEAFEEIEQSVEDFKNKLVEVQDAAKISFDEISNGQDNTLDKNKELLEDNEQLIKDAQEQLEEYQKLRTEVENLAKAYDAVRDAAMRAAQAAHTLAEEINTQSANANNDSIVGPNMSSNSSNGAGGANSGGSNNGGSNGGNNGGSNNTGSGSSSSSNTSSQTKKYYVTASHPSYGTIKTFGGPFTSRGEAETYIVTHESRLKSNGVLYKAPTIVEKYKTGGYTGNWTGGSDEDGGKLAFLHQKELVLNAEDTENYLQAVQEMRKLQSEVQNGTSMNILGNIFDAIADSINIRIADLQRQAERSDFRRSEFGLESSSMNQNIVINADFPDVSDAAEIQKAFDQILGMASQKANNKSR